MRFLPTAGTTTFSAQQIATAFAGVAGQAKTINGSALSAKQSLDLMKSAMDLAEASGTNLGSAAGDVTKALQVFGLNLSQSPLVSDVLYGAANKTGVSVDTLTQAFLNGLLPPKYFASTFWSSAWTFLMSLRKSRRWPSRLAIFFVHNHAVKTFLRRLGQQFLGDGDVFLGGEARL